MKKFCLNPIKNLICNFIDKTLEIVSTKVKTFFLTFLSSCKRQKMSKKTFKGWLVTMIFV